MVPMSAEISHALLRWADANRRDLPWRRTRDPWAILVSEVMLQQTQVARVLQKYGEFLATYPSASSLAEAPLGDVLVRWSGLGYPRRARNLHACAQTVVNRYGGVVPADLEQLEGLPGVGPYTARAVLTFAYERDVGVLDTNAARILARAATGRRLAASEAQELADSLVPTGRGWVWNQGILDLGATVCTKRSPSCGVCPLQTICVWQAIGGPDPAEGSAGVSGRQSRFAGSDREGRGKILRALIDGEKCDLVELALVTGWADNARNESVLSDLTREGLIVREGNCFRLP